MFFLFLVLLTPPAFADPVPQPLGEGRYQLGKVVIDSRQKTLEIPCRVNMTNSLIEYVLVADQGKTHESIFVSDAEPMSVHLGMLFLGAKVAEVPDPASIDFSLTTNGTPIQVEWKTEGDADWRKVDQLIAKEASDEVIRMPVWNYNGSWTFNGTFLAQRDRSIVSIIADRDALVNNQHKDRENDDFWVPKTPADWKIGTEVRIRLRLLKPEKTPNAKQSGDVKTKP